MIVCSGHFVSISDFSSPPSGPLLFSFSLFFLPLLFPFLLPFPPCLSLQALFSQAGPGNSYASFLCDLRCLSPVSLGYAVKRLSFTMFLPFSFPFLYLFCLFHLTLSQFASTLLQAKAVPFLRGCWSQSEISERSLGRPLFLAMFFPFFYVAVSLLPSKLLLQFRFPPFLYIYLPFF